jgi:polysaccharide biosynthesis transport protein
MNTMADQNLEWNDIKGFVRRRGKSLIFVFLIVFISSVIIGFTLPPIYRSETTIFVEERQIPENFVESTISTYAEERLNNIMQQVFSGKRLYEIIETYDLYPEIREKEGAGKAIGEMRNSMGMETESATFTNPRTGKTVSANIAFKLFYEGRDPETVRDVANVLSELIIAEDARIKEKMTTATTSFLSMEVESLKEQLQAYETKISEFKQKHFGELPEHSNVNLESIARLERELDRVNMQIRDLQDRKIIYEGQMTNVDPLLPINVDGESVARNPSERLKYLRLKLISLQSVLHDTHPDINKLKREIQDLENRVGATGDYREELKRLNSLKVELASMEGRYGEKHPDVIKLTKEIQILENSIDNKINVEETRHISEQIPDNSLYINLATQISSINASIDNSIIDRKRIQEELAKYRKRIENAPVVEKEYNELTRNYAATKRKYDELMNNLMAANVAKGIEEGQHGQRFEIKNHAYLPDKPYKPKRLVIILLGFVLASGLGLGLATIQEFFDHSIKTEKELDKLFGLPVLTVISRVDTRKEKVKRLFGGLIWACVFLGFITIGLKIVHEYFMPVNELWSTITNNIKNM